MLHTRWIPTLGSLLLFWLSTTSLQAQSKDDHLEPADWHYTTVEQLQKTAALAQVVVLTSFKSSYVLSIEQDKQRYYLTYAEMRRGTAPAAGFRRDSLVASSARKLAITTELARTLTNLWHAAIQQTRYPEPLMRIRTDGTRFVFSSFRPGMGLRAGTTWEPAAGTHMSSLAGIVTELHQLATAGAYSEQQQNLLEDARILLKALQPN
ncbi:hypothetical protein [Hymenobacter canadensis]|uniref:Uncharacterized protein n=1 Tax=Hymenobacter canadensis TaxID=2999067 RepID=A0ABY7LRD7_9BACT|nr:hypothetical protein [Hymenobacter canadensis]WBA42144.1 hypothetical protein O3303_00990 [Hymenobacter canadensis]